MIYHVISESYYQLQPLEPTQRASVAQEIFLQYKVGESTDKNKWEFIPYSSDSSIFCIEFESDHIDAHMPLLFTVEFIDSQAKATLFEPAK